MQLHKDAVLNATARQPDMAYRDVLQTYLEWLRRHDAALPEAEKVMTNVALNHFWWTGGGPPWSTFSGATDAPSLRLDALTDPEHRLVVIRCTPFHDEGGAAELTAWFEWGDGDRWYLIDMAMQFDTQRNMILRDGLFLGIEGF